ncbi:Ig-like domain-containing protein [Archangium sp.]|uniref:Ig-like domain-containing protein n=1 Tax=Archangium sp. TaxID=1872627 RepID=UPI00286B852F|nr:Ig-like domain-containing protein [Archangium sp.]
MGTTSSHRKFSSVSLSSYLPAMLAIGFVGAHLTAALLGLYSAAPKVSVVQPTTGASIEGRMALEVHADDGPTGSGVKSVAFQLDSTSGTWTQLTLDPSSGTYRGTWATASATEGAHAIYIRATDGTGNHRTVSVPVSVSHVTEVLTSGAPTKQDGTPSI